MHKRAARTSVAVGERVDCLKLRVCDRRLGERGEVVARHELAEVRHQLRQVTLVGWHEHRPSWGVVTAADPHLGAPQHTRDLRSRIRKQDLMHLHNAVHIRASPRHGGLHLACVRSNQRRISPSATSGLRLQNLACGRGELLNTAGCR